MLTIAFVVAAALEPLPAQWAHFCREDAFRVVSERVAFSTEGREGDEGFRYKLRLTRSALGRRTEVQWADSKRCPAVRAVVLSMRTMVLPSVAPPVMANGPVIITPDSAEYSLTAPLSQGGTLVLRLRGQSSVTNWIDASLAQLASCWTSAAN